MSCYEYFLLKYFSLLLLNQIVLKLLVVKIALLNAIQLELAFNALEIIKICKWVIALINY